MIYRHSELWQAKNLVRGMLFYREGIEINDLDMGAIFEECVTYDEERGYWISPDEEDVVASALRHKLE